MPPEIEKSSFVHFDRSKFWTNRKVVVTGGAGFLGHYIVNRLYQYGAQVIVPRKSQFNFIHADVANRFLDMTRPNIVIHSAAYYGGLGITMAEPGKIFYENLLMGANLMEAARLNRVGKFVTVGTACSYPGHLQNSLKEEDFWAGPLHDTVIAYGSVKKILAIQGLAYQRQFGFNSIHLIPSNLYGPFDCYEHYRSHVVAALIRKFCEAHSSGSNVTVWGTGKAVREFLYVEDCADGVIRATETYNDILPLNIGTGVGTSIAHLVELIVSTLGFSNRVIWDSSKPDGQKLKILNITKMKNALNWSPEISLKEGLEKTIRWYNKTFIESSAFKQAA